MNRYFIKPLFWNSRNYQKPTGEKAASGYPFKYGFGHEEWNNNAGNRIRLNGQWHRVFHITGLDPVKRPIEDDDNVVVFFIASHENVQYLLGIVSNISPVGSQKEQLRTARALDIESRWKDAWALNRVRTRKAFKGNEKKFRKFWTAGLYGDINYKCLEGHFLWFDQKRPISALEVTGKDRFPSMFGSFQELDAEGVQRLLNSSGLEGINLSGDGSVLMRDLRAKLLTNDDSIEEEVAEIERNKKLKPTTRKALIDARRGQGKFREDLLRRWDDKCCVTSCSIGVALRASHIRPWKTSNNADRRDARNGLLLVATVDALFDRGWISFEDNGAIKISSSITREEREELGLNGLRIRQPLSDIEKRNLHFHRTEKFDKHRCLRA